MKIEAKRASYNKIETIRWYLNRIMYEVIEPMMGDVLTLRNYIQQNYLPLNELYRFIEGARKALREVDRMIDEVLLYI